jgi:hypothetical protein
MPRNAVARDSFDAPEIGFNQPFLSTHKAQSACSRELSRLTAGVLEEVAALERLGVTDKAEVRQTPDRCIVQLGPVALTVAWLRSTLDTVADGELLIIVWRGAVAPPADHLPERRFAGRRAPATPLAERVFVAEAMDEGSWRWSNRTADKGSQPSAEVAKAAVAALHKAWKLHAQTAA